MDLDLIEVYGLEMGARQALQLLRQTGQADRLQARQLLSVMDGKTLTVPPSLHPLCKAVHLMQLAPANRLPL